LKKYNRELNSLTSKTDDLQKIEVLHKRVSDLFTSMKRLERENQKNKKRGDQLQKERDHARAEFSKTSGLKEKLEKLCRELQRENNRLKVRRREIGSLERRY
jgi:chromosome segregation ATPase